jgi:hypothetical protein
MVTYTSKARGRWENLESEASMGYIVSFGQTGLHSKNLSQKKKKERNAITVLSLSGNSAQGTSLPENLTLLCHLQKNKQMTITTWFPIGTGMNRPEKAGKR